MSVWMDIHKRSNGDMERKEESIYSYGAGYFVISKNKYKNIEYHIVAEDGCPYIKIITPLGISAITGMDKIEMKAKDGKLLKFDHIATKEHNIITYKFDKEDDYVEDLHAGHRNSHPGKKYTYSEIDGYAKEFIDQLQEMENRFLNDV